MLVPIARRLLEKNHVELKNKDHVNFLKLTRQDLVCKTNPQSLIDSKGDKSVDSDTEDTATTV